MGQRPGALPRNKRSTGFLSLWRGGQQSRAKGYIKCPGGWGRCPRLKLQQSAESCPHTRVFFVVSQQVALSRHWDLCGAPLPGRLSPEREAAGVIARYRCCVSS